MKKLILILAALPLAACSIGVKSDDKQEEPVNTFAHQVPGPGIDGAWESGCVDTGFRSEVITMTVKGQAITRTTRTFSDRGCVNADQTTTYPGKFRYKAVARTEGNDKVYVAEYELEVSKKQENGVTVVQIYTVQENMKPTPSVLYVSDFRVGDALTDIPLVRKAGTKTISAGADTSEFFADEN